MQNVFYKKDDQGYPELLRQIGKDAPKQIYCKFEMQKPEVGPSFAGPLLRCGQKNVRPLENGNEVRPQQRSDLCGMQESVDKSIFNNCLSVIGSRRLTNYGKQALEQLVSQIAASGITIVSGFMYGGDAIAHRSALQVGGRTIAVMPCGIDLIHPQDQEELYHDILKNNGLIISEYEGDIQPTLWTYPRRNRIVAGLSKALLIVEAGEKSGCLITANYAKKFKRKIFVVPGPITSSVSKGSNLLIKEGAEMVTEAGDVLEFFRSLPGFEVGPSFAGPLLRCGQKNVRPLENGNEVRPQQRSDLCGMQKAQGGRGQHSGYPMAKCNRPSDSRMPPDEESFETQVLEMLKREPLGVDELSRQLEMSSSELGVKLSMMEMQGLIEIRGSKYASK